MAHSLINFFSRFFSRRSSDTLRETITELIQEKSQTETSLNEEERILLKNVLRLRDLPVDDVMIPRADIIAISIDITFEDLIKLSAETPFTRLPVYQNTLDDLVGHIHVKDIALHAQDNSFDVRAFLQQVLFVPPSMRLLDLLLQMRSTQIPMAYVVDEHGGIDGLVTSWDIVREILGDLQDDHTPEISSQIIRLEDGTYMVDARVSIEDLEKILGPILTDKERQEDTETVGGLVLALTSRVPDRKELISHCSGIEFEVIESSPRSLNRLRVYPPKSL